MKKATIKEELALELTNRYKNTALTMEDIAALYNTASHSQNKISASTVSKCIYHCIFKHMLTPEEELKIVTKISDNRARHCKDPEKHSFMQKYNDVIKERQQYENLLDTLDILDSYESFLAEYMQSKDTDPNLFLSSEDEESYVPLRDLEEIRKDIKIYGDILKKRKIDVKNYGSERSYLERVIHTLEEHYRI